MRGKINLEKCPYCMHDGEIISQVYTAQGESGEDHGGTMRAYVACTVCGGRTKTTWQIGKAARLWNIGEVYKNG